MSQFNLGRIDEAIASFALLSTSTHPNHRSWCARALLNKGLTLGSLGRSENEIAVYDDLLARFGAATELPLREQVAKAVANRKNLDRS